MPLLFAALYSWPVGAAHAGAILERTDAPPPSTTAVPAPARAKNVLRPIFLSLPMSLNLRSTPLWPGVLRNHGLVVKVSDNGWNSRSSSCRLRYGRAGQAPTAPPIDLGKASPQIGL